MLKCDLCGTNISKNQATYTLKENDNEHIITCGNCSKLFKTCYLCEKGNECDFETNPSSTPKVIQQKIQKGPMTQIIQAMNPERIAETCEKNCSCYNAEYGCGKSFGICASYKEVFIAAHLT